MKTQEQIRQFLDKTIAERGTNYRELSLAIGRKDQYIHQYIKYGLPQELKEKDRKAIALFLNIDEQELASSTISAPITATGGKFSILKGLFSPAESNTVSIDILDISACCGTGSDVEQENIIGAWTIPVIEFKTISTTSQPGNVKMLRARGDSMAPTIKDGDWVLVDISNQSPDSDGLYLLRMSTGLAIKRIQGSVTDDVSIVSDNPKYPTLTAKTGDIRILGKIIYTLNAEKVG